MKTINIKEIQVIENEMLKEAIEILGKKSKPELPKFIKIPAFKPKE